MDAETRDYLTELGILKKQIHDTVQDLSDEAANWRPLAESTNSIYALLVHMTGSETYWVRQIINREALPRDREAEFRTSGGLREALGHLETTARANEQILAGLSAPQLGETRDVPVRPELGAVSVRWCVLHVISHYAVHLGHIQLTRQLWEQRK
ncbi:MAG: DUF664 domain-containing protein [Chloroflexi bacterium]|nr:DUF664 domain-containing protein [Chloroflexota bacterium]